MRSRERRARAAAGRLVEESTVVSAATCCASWSGAGRCSRARSRTTPPTPREAHRWWGERKMALMLDALARRGARSRSSDGAGTSACGISPSAGTRTTERISWPEATPDLRRRSASVPRACGSRGAGWIAHPDGRRRPGACRTHHFPVAVRPARVRPRPRRGAVGLPLPAGDVRAGREARVRLLRAPDPARRPGGRPDRALHDRKAGLLHVRGVWWEDGVRPVSLDRPLGSLARWLGATIA